MIYIDENQIRIQLFQKILRVSDQCIMVAMKNKKIIIDGYKLCITYLEKTEIIIVGRFKSIQFLEKEENLC
ncbi:sporulation protein YqfC [Firmicutes bacterium CAG:631]|jgi:hypothetical protein|nr:sporulation protein YqfC [Firmicutes bacterium CAG:631]